MVLSSFIVYLLLQPVCLKTHVLKEASVTSVPSNV